MSSLPPHRTKLFDVFFRDRQGNIVIAQWPNLPIIIAAAAWVAQFFIHTKPYHLIFYIVFYAALSIWAVLEVGWGVNYFRRVLGLVVLVISTMGLVGLFR